MTLGKRLSRAFRRMGLPAWTFAGLGIATLWFNAFGDLVKKTVGDVLQIGPDSSQWITYLPLLVVIAIPFVVVYLAARLLPRQDGTIVSDLVPPNKKKGIILLVSRLEHAMRAIEHHFTGEDGSLEKVWLIPSNEQKGEFFGTGSLKVTEAIKQECEVLAAKSNKKLQVEIHLPGVSPADAQDTYDYVNRVYRRSGYEPWELIADFTGGTKPMSVGMIMACLPTERELEYVAFHPQLHTMHGPFLIDYQHNAFDLIG